jgi:hypothetical protein
MATFVRLRADNIGALTVMSALVFVAAPAAASTVTLDSQHNVRPSLVNFERPFHISEPRALGDALGNEAVASLLQALRQPADDSRLLLREPSAGPKALDFASAESVARQIFDATKHGPGSDLFGLVGLALWALWWRRRLPALDT